MSQPAAIEWLTMCSPFAVQVPVLTLLHALPMLSDVAILCLFAMFVFGIVAVQMFAGVMRNR
jgi:hypothetical protein